MFITTHLNGLSGRGRWQEVRPPGEKEEGEGDANPRLPATFSSSSIMELLFFLTASTMAQSLCRREPHDWARARMWVGVWVPLTGSAALSSAWLSLGCRAGSNIAFALQHHRQHFLGKIILQKALGSRERHRHSVSPSAQSPEITSKPLHQG